MSWLEKLRQRSVVRKAADYLNGKLDAVVGLDIGSGYIKVAQIVWQQDQPVLTHWAVQELPDQVFNDGVVANESVLVESIRRAVATSGATARHVVFAIGGRSVFSREITVPFMGRDELAEAIKWDMEKYVPYAPDTFYYDFAKLEQKNNDLEMKVLLVAAPQDVVDPLVRSVKEADLIPLAVDTEPFAIYRTLGQAENSLVLDVGAFISQLIIYQQGCPVFSRAIPIGGQHFTQALMQVLELDFPEAEHLKRKQTLLQSVGTAEGSDVHVRLEFLVRELARDVRRTLEFYQTQNREAQLSRCILCGGGILLTHFKEHLAELLERPVEIHNPLDALQLAASFDKLSLKQGGAQMAVALGLALRGEQV